MVPGSVTRKGSLMSIKLTETQRAMLNDAALREDRCLPRQIRGERRSGRPRETDRGRICSGSEGQAVVAGWRHDDQSGSAFALKLTAAGMKAIAVEESGPQRPLVLKDRVASPNPKTRQDRSASSPDAREAQGQMTGHPTAPGNAKSEPRPGSKIAAVIGMLAQETGATIGELIATTGWLPHTTRAAFTGLRKRGYVLAVDRSNRERGSVYRIEAKPGEAKSGAGDPVAEAA